jgi:hypothetical protein
MPCFTFTYSTERKALACGQMDSCGPLPSPYDQQGSARSSLSQDLLAAREPDTPGPPVADEDPLHLGAHAHLATGAGDDARGRLGDARR